jgi:hypothetical protein
MIQYDILAGIGLVVSLIVAAIALTVAAVVRAQTSDSFPVHGELICKNGIYDHENLDFTGLIADRKYQFAYIFSPAPIKGFSPAPIKGATGSNGGPIAVT